MDRDAARQFVKDNHQAVLVTHRRDGSLQTSPIAVGVDDGGRLIISSRETAYKVRNLRRDPRATLCVTKPGSWEWIQVDGTAAVLSLPEAMEPLVDYYRKTVGEHPDWDDYRRAMQSERRVLVRIDVERAGPDRAG